MIHEGYYFRDVDTHEECRVLVRGKTKMRVQWLASDAYEYVTNDRIESINKNAWIADLAERERQEQLQRDLGHQRYLTIYSKIEKYLSEDEVEFFVEHTKRTVYATAIA